MWQMLFGRGKSPQEQLRQHQRALQKAQRELDRERGRLEQQEKKLVVDIRTSARKGQMGACKVMAQDLVRTRNYIHKFYVMRTQLQAVSLRLQTMRSNETMAQTMRGAARSMTAMSRRANLPQMQRIMQDFERESEIMNIRQDMMSDTMDDAMEADEFEDSEEPDQVLRQVLDEVGVSVSQDLKSAPEFTPTAAQSAAPARVPVAEGAPPKDVSSLESRLDNLRKD